MLIKDLIGAITVHMTNVFRPPKIANTVKRNTSLKDGDFVVHVPVNMVTEYHHDHESHIDNVRSSQSSALSGDCLPIDIVKFETEHMSDDSNHFFKKLSEAENTTFKLDLGTNLVIELKIIKVSMKGSCYDFFLSLQKQTIIPTLMKTILCEGLNYGFDNNAVKDQEEIENFLLTLMFDMNCNSLQDLRILFIYEHFCELLKFAKVKVESSFNQKVVVPSEISHLKFNNFALLKYQNDYHSQRMKDEIRADFMKSIVGQQQKNYTIEELIDWEYCRQNKFSTKRKLHCIHIIPYQKSHRCNLSRDIWNKVTAVKDVHLTHGDIEVGSVVNRKSSSTTLPSVQDFLKLRESQVKEAFSMKYGECSESDFLAKYSQSLTYATLSFEFLVTNSRNTLKIDLEKDKLETKGGIFLVYNYARLATLFEKYEKWVKMGKYPVLPKVEEVDFSLLREEEEWELIFNYLLVFPSVIHECVQNIHGDKNPVLTSKIPQFLQDFCRDFSSYYNRVHILCEPYDHLLPQMFARLYLMKAIQQVLCNGLNLLNIDLIEKM